MKALLALIIWGFNPTPDTTWSIDTNSVWFEMYEFYLGFADTTEARNRLENFRLTVAIEDLADILGYGQTSIDRGMLYEYYYGMFECWPEGRYETEAQYDYLIDNPWIFYRILRERVELRIDILNYLNGG